MRKHVRSFRELVYAYLWAVTKHEWTEARSISNEIARRGSPEQRFSAIERWVNEHGDAYPKVAEWARKELAEARARYEPYVVTYSDGPWSFGQ